MATVKLNTVEQIGVQSEFQTFLTENRIKATVIRKIGSGGGWPEIKYTGTITALKVMIWEFWGDTALWKFIKK